MRGRDDLVPRAAVLLARRELVAGQRYAADRGHAVREPELVGVLGLRVLRRPARMDVQIDEARAGHTYPSRRSRSRAARARGWSASAAPACRHCESRRSGCSRRRCRPDRAEDRRCRRSASRRGRRASCRGPSFVRPAGGRRHQALTVAFRAAWALPLRGDVCARTECQRRENDGARKRQPWTDRHASSLPVEPRFYPSRLRP